MKLVLLPFLAFCFLLFTGCKEEEQQKAPPTSGDCKVYTEHIDKLEKQLLEVERNADKLEDVIYHLTQNYMAIDQKIRLIQKYKDDGSQAKLLDRTATEINRFFEESQLLLDSTEVEIQKSAIPQSSMIPIIETVRSYLTHQERLFIEVYGSIGSIHKQVARLKQTVAAKEKEISNKQKDTEKILEEKDKQNRKIFYLVGSRGDLERAKAIKKSGGFLGVGSSVKLSDRLDEMFFQSGDFKFMKEIALGNTKKVNLITTHPKGTYLILDTPGERFLKITNPEKFWSTSTFLVVEVD
ncbi:MAG TPA: hypothetical protein PLK63_01140 [Catalimonadaceae bacterium]|nr:hypothetical protein [Catalimonadaceae bacterium]